MIDTLKLSRRLINHGMNPQQAEDFADELNRSFKESVVTKSDLNIALTKLENKLIVWQFGISFGLFAAMCGILYLLK